MKHVAFLSIIFVATLCGNVRAQLGYDAKPKRSLFEDRWSGWYYTRVNAAYTLSLEGQLRTEKRVLDNSIQIFSKTDRVLPFEIEADGVSPSIASVSIAYPDPQGKGGGIADVTLYWDLPNPDLNTGQRQQSETRRCRMSARDIRHFLRRSMRFRVDDDYDYYTHMRGQSKESHEALARKVSVGIEITRRNGTKEGKLEWKQRYHDEYELRQIVDRAWSVKKNISPVPISNVDWQAILDAD